MGVVSGTVMSTRAVSPARRMLLVQDGQLLSATAVSLALMPGSCRRMVLRPPRRIGTVMPLTRLTSRDMQVAGAWSPLTSLVTSSSVAA